MATLILSPVYTHTYICYILQHNRAIDFLLSHSLMFGSELMNSLGFYKRLREPLRRIPHPGSDPQQRHLWRYCASLNTNMMKQRDRFFKRVEVCCMSECFFFFATCFFLKEEKSNLKITSKISVIPTTDQIFIRVISG